MDKSLIVKLRNYFSDRIEEIKEGSYVPTYEQIKKLPEFSGIKREPFRIARNKWNLHHFSMPFVKFTARLEENKGGYISEKEYDKKQVRRKHNTGLCCLIPGVLLIVGGILYGFTLNNGLDWSILQYIQGTQLIAFGIILIVIGILLILYNRFKLSEDVSRVISDVPELEVPLELSLRDKVEALTTSPNKAKDFYISVRNRNSNIGPDVKVQLSGPPQVKIVDATKSYGSIGGFSSRSARFTVLAEETGTFTLTATLQYKVDHEITLSIEFRVEPGA